MLSSYSFLGGMKVMGILFVSCDTALLNQANPTMLVQTIRKKKKCKSKLVGEKCRYFSYLVGHLIEIRQIFFLPLQRLVSERLVIVGV